MKWQGIIFQKLELFSDQKHVSKKYFSQRVICPDIQVHGHQQAVFEVTAPTNKVETAGTINPK